MPINKIIGLEVKDEHRFDSSGKMPNYLATVRIKIGKVYVIVEDAPVESTASPKALFAVHQVLEEVLEFLKLAEDAVENAPSFLDRKGGAELGGANLELKAEDKVPLKDEATFTLMKPDPDPHARAPSRAVTRGDLYTVKSSHGTITITKSGSPFYPAELLEPDSEDGKHLVSVTRFNVDEWKKYWGKMNLDAQLDILDLGYWYVQDGVEKYEEPNMTWRKDCAEQNWGRKPARTEA